VWRQSEDLWCVLLHLGEEQSLFPPISIFRCTVCIWPPRIASGDVG
jgi:hypothetical protein